MQFIQGNKVLQTKMLDLQRGERTEKQGDG